MNALMLKGLAVSPGIGQGVAYVVKAEADFVATRRKIAEGEIGAELTKFESALAESEVQLRSLKMDVEARLGKVTAALLDAPLLILRDPSLAREVSVLVREDRLNIEWAVAEVKDRLIRRFSAIEDPYFRERGADIRDAGRRILSVLVKRQRLDAIAVPEDSIVVAQEILPSASAHMELHGVRGYVTERGGKTSHSSILARSLGTPAVTGVSDVVAKIKTGDYLIVDGIAGMVFVNPTASVRREYERLNADLLAFRSSLRGLVDLPTQTLDGIAVKLRANIGKSADAESASLVKAEGVGLFRTEFSYSIRDAFPTEEEQIQILMAVAERFHPHPVWVRVLDIGGDKSFPYFPLPASTNPSLAKRGIRLMLKHPAILKAQLRAILRVSARYHVSVLLPMVCGMEDVVEAKKILEGEKASLKAERRDFDAAIPLGAMIETASAAVVIGRLVKELDFFSLGTNDLTQYLLAADRGDENMAPYYQPLHPAMLQVIKALAETVSRAGKELSICGEMAGDPVCTELLLGLGLRSLSVSPRDLLEIKNVVRSIRVTEAEHLAREVLELDCAQKIETLLQGRHATLVSQAPRGRPGDPVARSATATPVKDG